MSLKIYYLTAEIAPFCETYSLANFSRKITNRLNLKTDVDIRVSQPKYGFISERKYILREVIRLKDLPIIFNDEKHIINMKSAFIPDTRVQVYFMENNFLYKELSELIYKSRNGRIISDLDYRFTFFNQAALENLKSLFWKPDVIICNDWQSGLLPAILKQNFSKDEFYSEIKSVYLLHSVNNYRKYSKTIYDIYDLNVTQTDKKIDCHIEAMENADLTIALNHESDQLLDKMKKQENLYRKFESSNHMVIDVPKNASLDDWKQIANMIESACKDL